MKDAILLGDAVKSFLGEKPAVKSVPSPEKEEGHASFPALDLTSVTAAPPADTGKPRLPRKAEREILQSYQLTTAIYDFNVYEKRILYNIIRYAQKELEGITIRDNLRTIDHSLKGSVQLVLPMSDFLTRSDDKNHRRIQDALKRLQRENIVYKDKTTWASVTIVANPKIKTVRGISTVRFTVDELVWNLLLDFSRGYSKFYFDVAFGLESAYSMRLYEILSSQKHPICFTIEDIRKTFKLDSPKVLKSGTLKEDGTDLIPKRTSSRYKNTSDLIRKVIEPSKKELDAKSPVSFTYEPIRTGKKITAIRFTPVKRNNKLSPDRILRREMSTYGSAGMLSRDEIRILKEVGFSGQGIDNNLTVFLQGKKALPDFLFELADLQGRCRGKENSCGWFISALKGRIRDENKKSGKKL